MCMGKLDPLDSLFRKVKLLWYTYDSKEEPVFEPYKMCDSFTKGESSTFSYRYRNPFF